MRIIPVRSVGARSAFRVLCEGMTEETLDLVNEEGERIGVALRSEVHGNLSLLHQAVHVFVFNAAGELFLQKRSRSKDVQPGKWDTSVGGHVDLGEDAMNAAVREAREELGVDLNPLEPLYEYIWESDIEREFIRSYRARSEGPFSLEPREIEEGRFWSVTEIENALGSGILTPNFEHEWPRLQAWIAGGA